MVFVPESPGATEAGVAEAHPKRQTIKTENQMELEVF